MVDEVKGNKAIGFTKAGKVRVVLVDPKYSVDKDAPMLADAKTSKSDVLVTIDKKDFLQPKVHKFMYPIKIMTPGEVNSSLYICKRSSCKRL